jgi:hypothetical protein
MIDRGQQSKHTSLPYRHLPAGSIVFSTTLLRTEPPPTTVYLFGCPSSRGATDRDEPTTTETETSEIAKVRRGELGGTKRNLERACLNSGRRAAENRSVLSVACFASLRTFVLHIGG